MGKAKTSRKGKKAWRRNIDASKVEAAIEKRSTEERKGLELSGKRDEDLFFVDKVADATPASGSRLSKRAKRVARGAKLLKCQAILQGAHQARPVEGVVKRKPKGGPGLKAHQLAKKQEIHAPTAPLPNVSAADGDVGDVWSEDAGEGSADDWGKMPAVKGKKQPTLRGRFSKTSREMPLPSVAAVEIDAPGCSYNPDYEQHQDAIAEAVAAEVYKEISKELLPKAPPLFVNPEDAEQLDELQKLLVDEEEDNHEEDGEVGGDGVLDGVTGKKAEKKTKSKRNREKIAREAARELEQRRLLKKQRHELSNLKQLTAEIEDHDKERELVGKRRETMQAEKAQSKTPRLGKTPFKDAPIQVLTTDEVEHNLRRLKAHPMLVRDRFAALQKRGAIEPTRKVQKRQGNRVEFQNSASREKAVAAQEEINKMRVQRRKLSKKLKRSQK